MCREGHPHINMDSATGRQKRPASPIGPAHAAAGAAASPGELAVDVLTESARKKQAALAGHQQSYSASKVQAKKLQREYVTAAVVATTAADFRDSACLAATTAKAVEARQESKLFFNDRKLSAKKEDDEATAATHDREARKLKEELKAARKEGAAGSTLQVVTQQKIRVVDTLANEDTYQNADHFPDSLEEVKQTYEFWAGFGQINAPSTSLKGYELALAASTQRREGFLDMVRNSVTKRLLLYIGELSNWTHSQHTVKKHMLDDWDIGATHCCILLSFFRKMREGEGASELDTMTALVGKQLAENTQRMGERVVAGYFKNFPKDVPVHLLNKIGCRTDVRPMVHYAILLWGASMVDVSTAEGRDCFTDQRKTKKYKPGNEVTLSNVTGTMRDLEAAGGFTYKGKRKLRPQWEAQTHSLCFLVPPKVEDRIARNGPTCPPHFHEQGITSTPAKQCPLCKPMYITMV